MSRWDVSFPEPHGAMPQGSDPGENRGRIGGVKHFCAECCWHGNGLAALDHWRKTQHRITLINGQEVSFG